MGKEMKELKRHQLMDRVLTVGRIEMTREDINKE